MWEQQEGFTAHRCSVADARVPLVKLTKAAMFSGATGALACPIRIMPYHVISLTMAQVRQGALAFQRDLSAALPAHPEIKVYSVSPFDLDERRRFKDHFGGDIIYFFNEGAWQECEQLGLDLNSLAEISEAELPRRRTMVVGTPDRVTGSGAI
jgi:hypothetical protein